MVLEIALQGVSDTYTNDMCARARLIWDHRGMRREIKRVEQGRVTNVIGLRRSATLRLAADLGSWLSFGYGHTRVVDHTLSSNKKRARIEAKWNRTHLGVRKGTRETQELHVLWETKDERAGGLEARGDVLAVSKQR